MCWKVHKASNDLSPVVKPDFKFLCNHYLISIDHCRDLSQTANSPYTGKIL